MGVLENKLLCRSESSHQSNTRRSGTAQPAGIGYQHSNPLDYRATFAPSKSPRTPGPRSQAAATPIGMVRLCPTFLAAPPDLTLTGEKGHPPGPGGLIGLPEKGGLEGRPRWKEAGLVSPNLCL